MSIPERKPGLEEDDLDWFIRRALQASVAGAEPPDGQWWQLRRTLAGGPGPRRAHPPAPLRRGPSWLAVAMRLSSRLNRIWPAPLGIDQAALLEQKWAASFVLLGFAPLGRVY